MKETAYFLVLKKVEMIEEVYMEVQIKCQWSAKVPRRKDQCLLKSINIRRETQLSLGDNKMLTLTIWLLEENNEKFIVII